MKAAVVLAGMLISITNCFSDSIGIEILEEAAQSKKKAIIFGVSGQDGAYLSELLLQKGYEVHGVERRSSLLKRDRLNFLIGSADEPLQENFILHYGDVTDATNITRILQEVKPDEIYNLAAQSHVAVSFETPLYTAEVDALGMLRILEAVKLLGLTKVRIYQASTSELYGKVQEIPQRETTPFYPRSPYGVAKLYAFWVAKNYREAYDMFICNGILFNHESPLRGETFVTRKITRAVARIKHGYHEPLRMGNLDAKRDWGYAKDYVEAMWLMLQQEKPDDYIIASGEAHSVREFVECAFREVGIEIVWDGEGVHEVGKDKDTGQVLVKVDPRFFRPAEVDYLQGDPSKAKAVLGWMPQTSFAELVKKMVDADLETFAHVRSPVLSNATLADDDDYEL